MNHKAVARMSTLYTRDKASLREIVERYYRVVDTQGVDKGTLIAMIMEAEFGRSWNRQVDSNYKD